MQFNIIGAGRLGKNIAAALLTSGQATLGAVLNKHYPTARLAITQLGDGVAIDQLEALPAAALTFITTPDDTIAQLVLALVQKKVLTAGSMIVHCSGVLSSDVLLPLREHQCLIASFHPLKAFRAGIIDATNFRGCDCVMEGDSEALSRLSSYFLPLGANLISINNAHKATYHAAAVIASNYVVTLAAQAVALLQDAGINPELGRAIIGRLMQSSLDNICQAASLPDALTGPLARGDVATLNKHLEALTNPTQHAFYKIAALATLPLTDLTPSQQKSILSLLEAADK